MSRCGRHWPQPAPCDRRRRTRRHPGRHDPPPAPTRSHSASRICANAAPAAIAGPESRRIGSSRTSASIPISASCSSTMKRYAVLVTTIGRSNSAGSETLQERVLERRTRPEQGQELLGMDLAGSRPQPRSGAAAHDQGNNSSAHRLSNPVKVSIPGDKIAKSILDRCLRFETRVAHQLGDIGEGLGHVSRLQG